MKVKLNQTVRPKVMPHGLAIPYVNDGPYKMVTKSDGSQNWSYIYKNSKLVLDCNPVFAETWFKDI